MRVMEQGIRRETDEIVSWIGRYEIGVLALKRETTRRTYTLILQQFLTWLGSQPGHEPPFDPSGDLTQTAVQTYLFDELADTTFHDLRHDFGHRLRASGFTLEEVAVSLGHVTRKGTQALATTARYTQPNREQMKHKLKDLSL